MKKLTIFYIFLLIVNNLLLLSSDQNVINPIEYQDCQALHKAILNGQDITILLQQLGFHYKNQGQFLSDFVDKNGNTIYHHACYLKHTELIKICASCPKNFMCQNNAGMTPLFYLHSFHFYALSKKDLLIKDFHGRTLLTWHIEQNHLDVVEQLMTFIQKQAISLDEIELSQPYVHVKSLDMVKVLSKFALCRSTIKSDDLVQTGIEFQKNAPLSRRNFQKKVNMQESLAMQQAFWSSINTQPHINIRNKDKETLLHYAVKNNNLSVIQRLIERGIDIFAQDIRGNTALHIAVFDNNIELVLFLLHHAEMIGLQNKSNLLEIKNKEGRTVLMEAVIANQLDLVQLLLAQGASIFVKNRYRHGLLHFVNDPALAQQLISAGLSVYARGIYGDIPLHFAATPEVALVLINNGSMVNITNNEQHIPLYTAKNTAIAAVLIKAGSNIDSINSKGLTVLHYAVMNNNVPLCKLLLDNNANTTKPLYSYVKDENGKNKKIIKIDTLTDLLIYQGDYCYRNYPYVQENLKDLFKQRNLFKDRLFVSFAYPDTLPEEKEYTILRDKICSRLNVFIMTRTELDDYNNNLKRLAEVHDFLMMSGNNYSIGNVMQNHSDTSLGQVDNQAALQKLEDDSYYIYPESSYEMQFDCDDQVC